MWGHDAIEDARVTYNDLLKFGTIAADIIYLCTEDKGKNREERKSIEWYHKLNTNNFILWIISFFRLISNWGVIENEWKFYKSFMISFIISTKNIAIYSFDIFFCFLNYTESIILLYKNYCAIFGIILSIIFYILFAIIF